MGNGRALGGSGPGVCCPWPWGPTGPCPTSSPCSWRARCLQGQHRDSVAQQLQQCAGTRGAAFCSSLIQILGQAPSHLCPVPCLAPGYEGAPQAQSHQTRTRLSLCSFDGLQRW